MAGRSGLKRQLAKALDKLHADVIHVGLFDYAGLFRERRLRQTAAKDGRDRHKADP